MVAGRLLSGFSRLFTHFLQVTLDASALKQSCDARYHCMTIKITAGRLVLTILCVQGNGFTCGIDDVILNPEAEAKRAEVLTGADATALRASAEAAGLPSLKVSISLLQPLLLVMCLVAGAQDIPCSKVGQRCSNFWDHCNLVPAS